MELHAPANQLLVVGGAVLLITMQSACVGKKTPSQVGRPPETPDKIAASVDSAEEPTAPAERTSVIAISDAFMYPPTWQKNGYPSLILRNSGTQSDFLIGAEAPIAASISFLQGTSHEDTWTSRAVDKFEIPAGGSLRIRHRENTIALRNLTQNLSVGESFELTLKFSESGPRNITVRIVAWPPLGDSPE